MYGSISYFEIPLISLLVASMAFTRQVRPIYYLLSQFSGERVLHPFVTPNCASALNHAALRLVMLPLC